MRIVINIDAVKDPDRIGKKTVRVRTGYYFSNGGDCQRHKLGAEPCTDCPYCDERGNI